MTKGLEEMLTTLQITGKSNRIYHGRTQLGVGEHDRIKKRLEEERQKDYQDHMRKKEMERARKQTSSGEPQCPSGLDSSTSSVADIGYETSLSIAQQRKQLNDTRRAEYAAHLAAQSAASQTERNDGSHISTQTPTAQLQDGCTNTLQMSSPEMEKADDRRQKQRDYAEALREQIAEKKRNSETNKRREKEQDKKNMEMAQGSNKNFIYGSNTQLNSPPAVYSPPTAYSSTTDSADAAVHSLPADE